MFTILGGNGRVGRAAAAVLRGLDLPVRVVVRSEGQAVDLARLGCHVRVADLKDLQSLCATLEGSTAVQVICPLTPLAEDVLGTMESTASVIAKALQRVRPDRVVAISDYGAHLASGTGIALAFHAFERHLRSSALPLTIIRSAEHMQNGARLLPEAARTGILPSLHVPTSRSFPSVAAGDVGTLAAHLMVQASRTPLRIVHVEGPARYSAQDVANALGVHLGRAVVAQEVPESYWTSALVAAGASASYAALVAAAFAAGRDGMMDVDPHHPETIRGPTTLEQAVGDMARSLDLPAKAGLPTEVP